MHVCMLQIFLSCAYCEFSTVMHTDLLCSNAEANFLNLCIFVMHQCICKFSGACMLQIFYSYAYQFPKHAYANFLELCKLRIFQRYACTFLMHQYICKFSGAMHICGLTICGQNGKYLKIFPVQQGILLLLLHLTKLANAKSDKEERLQILSQANSERILKGQCDENIV